MEKLIEKEKRKLEEIRDNPEYYDGIREDIRKRIKKYNDELNARQKSKDPLNGRLKNQITSFKETIAKLLDKVTSLAEKIQTRFGEQGITIDSILTATGMTISILVEAPKDKAEAKEWFRNKLKALARLLRRLGTKAKRLCLV